MENNTNKNIVVSGASKGIGLAIAEAFASKGFNIAICSRNEADLKAVKGDIEGRFPGSKVIYQATDMADKKQVLAFAEMVKASFSKIDILVNNAGVFIPGTIQEEEEGILEQMMNTNLYSAYNLTRALLPGLIEKKSGHIFNICSTASIMAYENGGSYCISKFAMLGFSKVLRSELKEKGIRVTSILPGATFTASWEGVDIPQERFMKASDIAEALLSAYELSDRTVVEEMILRPQLGDL